jgi:hypothetical protein
VVDAPDHPAAVRARLEPATPRVPETGGRAREKPEDHDRFDLSHARRQSLRATAYAVYLTRMRMPGAGGAERPAELLPLVKEFREGAEELNGDQGGLCREGDDPTEFRKALKAAAGSRRHGEGQPGEAGASKARSRKRRRSRNAELGPPGGGSEP